MLSDDNAPQSMPNAQLAALCARETDLFLHQKAYDPQYCFELFRRAFKERLEEAWDLIVKQYQAEVLKWVKRHPSFRATNEEAEGFVFEAFMKMWQAISPEKFDSFSGLAGLLGYLKMCVGSILIDRTRTIDRLNPDELDETHEEQLASHDPSPEQQLLSKMDSQQLLEALRHKIPDKKEWLVITAMYLLDLKPREILIRYKKEFESMDEIYRIKQNVFARLRRDDDLRGFFVFASDN